MGDASGAKREPVVLLVDDDEDTYNLYSDFLAMSGFSVLGANDGNEALELAVRLRPDLIVMDLGLPVLDGGEATRRLRADARTRSIPILALTGFVQPYYIELATQAGCDAFLGKPCSLDRLLTEVKRLTGQACGYAAAQRPQILLVEDDDDIRVCLASVLERRGFSVVEARHGLEALDYLRAADQPPRLILLDLMMPVMDGWQFRAAQLEDARLRSIPVVVLSAVTNLRRGGQLEGAECLSKPVDVDTLLSTLERIS